eukprot:jgi/Mesvir1/14847/Mv26258-RA.1
MSHVYFKNSDSEEDDDNLPEELACQPVDLPDDSVPPPSCPAIMPLEAPSRAVRLPTRAACPAVVQTIHCGSPGAQLDQQPYITALASSGGALVAATSDVELKVYDQATGQHRADIHGPQGQITDLGFPYPSAEPWLVAASSSDGCIRFWDIRSQQKVAQMSAPGQEIWSFSAGGSAASMVAGGGNATVLLWDRRKPGKIFAQLEESHSDAVTQTRFSAQQPAKLVTGSVDGLMVVIDVSGSMDEDDCIDGIMNVDSSIARIGFCGVTSDMLWCTSTIETLSLWRWTDATRVATFENTREVCSAAWNTKVDYLISCEWGQQANRLWLVGGTQEGSVAFFPAGYTAAGVSMGEPDVVLEGAHKSVVRSLLWDASRGL